METTLGARIGKLRKEKGLKQEQLAEMLGVSGQAVSKWENDQNSPEISLLPRLAKILGTTVDELLCGKKKEEPEVRVLPENQRKNIKDMMLRICVSHTDGEKVRINLPMALIQVALDYGMQIPHISGIEAMENVDLAQIMTLISQGVVGNLLEVETSDGETVQISVE